MSYEITINKKETKETTEREYKQVADSGNERDGGPVYEYVEYPSTKTVSTKVFEQEVDEIDMTEVIKAVNKID